MVVQVAFEQICDPEQEDATDSNAEHQADGQRG
jgi:hypothetical protein